MLESTADNVRGFRSALWGPGTTRNHQPGRVLPLLYQRQTESHSLEAGALEPDCLGSIQGHLWGQAEHSHWPRTRLVPRTAQPDASSATAAGFLKRGVTEPIPWAGSEGYKRSYKAERGAPHTETTVFAKGRCSPPQLSVYLIGGQAVQGMKRFRRGGLQLAKVTQQGQVPKDSVMRLSAKQTRRR